MGRKILIITTDRQRDDALGCNDSKAPRASMITGQHVRTHGVLMNGIALPADAPSVGANRDDLIADLRASLPPAGPKLQHASTV